MKHLTQKLVPFVCCPVSNNSASPGDKFIKTKGLFHAHYHVLSYIYIIGAGISCNASCIIHGLWTIYIVDRHIDTLTRDFFQNLFTKDKEVDYDLLMPLCETRVTQGMNDLLCKEFTEEEIGDTLF